MKKPTSPLLSASRLASLILAAAPIFPSAALAVDWNGSSSNVWTTGANWTGGAMPPQSGVARFADGGNGNTVIDLTSSQQTIYSLLFDTENAASYTIGAEGAGAQALRLANNGNVTVNSNVTTSQTINANLSLGNSDSDSWLVFTNHSTAPGQLLTLAGNISSSPATKTSTRTIAFTGAGDIAVTGAITEGAMSPVALTKTGPGTLTLSNANTYSLTTSVGYTMNANGQTPSTALGGGTLQLDFSASTAPTEDILYHGIAKGQVNLSSGNLEIIGKAGVNNSQTVGDLYVYAGLSNISVKAGEGGKAVLNLGAIKESSNAAHSLLNFDIGPGVQDATNGITTTSTNNAGVLRVGGSVATVNRTDWATNATNAAGGNIVAFTGYVASTATTVGTGNNDNVDYVVDAVVTGTNNQINTVRFNKANTETFSNTLKISEGADLILRGSSIMITANVGADDVLIEGGGLLKGGGNRGLSIYQYNLENVLRINTTIADNGTGGNVGFVVIAGGGKVEFNAVNTFSQGVMVTDGSTLIVSSEENLAGNSGVVTVIQASTTAKTVTLSGAPEGFGVGSTLLGRVVTAWNPGTGVATLNAESTVDISSATGVSWATAGALSLNGGTLVVTESMTMRQSNSAGAVGGPATVDRNIGLGAYGGTIDVASGKNLTVTGVVSSQANDGLGGLTKAGEGTLTLSGNNTYVGGTRLQAGVVALDSAGALGTKGTIEFNGGALRFGANNATDYSSRFSTKDGQSFKFDTNGQNVSLGTALKSAGGSLVVNDSTGTGSLTLTQASSYTGETTVKGGTLKAEVAGAIATSSAINVRTGARLDLSAITNYSTGAAQRFGGGGTVVAQSLTIQGDFSTHDSVDAIGTLNVTNSGALTFANGAHYSLNIGEGTGDALVATGIVKLGLASGDTVALTLNLTATMLEGTTYSFMSAGSGLLENNGLFSYNGTALSDGDVFDVYSNGFVQSFRINYGTTSNTLTALEAIPEPGTWAMLLGGIGALALGQRFRRQRK